MRSIGSHEIQLGRMTGKFDTKQQVRDKVTTE